MIKTLAAVSNFLRAIVSVVIASVLGLGVWLGYRAMNSHELELQAKERELQASLEKIDSLNKQVATQQVEIERLHTVVKLLKVDHRVAEIVVLDQWPADDKKQIVTRFQFTEVDGQGHPLAEPREFRILGDVVYIDAWVAKFKDEFVEQGDPLRGTSLCIFRRLFGEFQEPNDGYPIDPVGSRPVAYSPGDEMSDLEKELWSHFWEIANDPAWAEKLGIRSVHGDAPSIKLQKGRVYRVRLRASGGLDIPPSEPTEPKAGESL
jgi:hypothetical protein